MTMVDGWLQQAKSVPSPNRDARPPGEAVSLLVIHNISLPPGEFGNGHVLEFFTNSLDAGQHPYFQTIADLRVSSHLLIDRRGEVMQLVSFLDRAWHAGASCFEGRQRCNDFSIGIELEGTDIDPYTDCQYDALCQVTTTIMQAYPNIALPRIVGHGDISPGRKTDPGDSFDWHRYLGRLKGGSS